MSFRRGMLRGETFDSRHARFLLENALVEMTRVVRKSYA